MFTRRKKKVYCMSGEKPKKKGHSVGLGKVIGIVIVALFVGMILGGYLSFFVIAPQLQKMNIQIPGFSNTNNQNTNNQNNNNNNTPTTNNPNNNNGNNNSNNGNNNASPSPSGNNNNNNQNNNGPAINNNNPSPSNPTASYGGSGQFTLTMHDSGNTYSGTMTANINCQVEQRGNNIQLSVDLSPTSVSGSLQQAIPVGGSDTIFNFVGTTSGTQLTANSQGTTGNGQTFDFNLSGTIDSNTITFTMTSASDSQVTVSTQQISIHNTA
jgi:hypothetical protein